jgi:DNA (cytosine-5)-methyltransferase 1
MTTLPERILSGEVEAPDLFCGGTPCQAFSVAGLRNSLDDARGNLSLTFVGIANAIDYVRSVRSDPPAIVFWENVPGVLSTKDNAFGCFLAGLAGEDNPLEPPRGKWTNSGYVLGPKRAVAWRVLDAQYFGVAQRRRRVFVVASARDDFDPAAVLFEFDGVRRDSAPSREAKQEIAEGAGTGATFSCAGIGPYIEDNAAATLLKSGQDLGNGCEALVSQTVQTLRCRRPGEGGMSGDDEHLIPMISPALNTQSGANHAPDTKAYLVQPTYAIQGSMIGRNDKAGPQGDGINEEVCFTQNTIDRHAVAQPISYGIRTANTSSNGWGIQEEVTHTLDCAQGVAVAQPFQETADCLTSAYGTKWNGNASATNGSLFAAQAMAVRRLTPVECERLQGFPDGYTNIPWRKKDESPDGPRYKALGNSWAVPVVRWIGNRIQESIRETT